jgi:hypothetical protein
MAINATSLLTSFACVLAAGAAAIGQQPNPCQLHWTLNRTDPAPRYGACMAFDAARNRVLLFGESYSQSSLGAPADTWVWDGTTWTQLFPAVSPLPVFNAAMTYDSARQRVILFGGSYESQSANALDRSLRNDTWEWDGAAWAQATPPALPTARRYHALAYDSVRHETVLFGGFDANDSPLADTWVWNGSTWTQRSPATSPPARADMTMGFDPDRGRVVLFGGKTGQLSGSTVLGDTWEWDGANWLPFSPVTTPGLRHGTSLSYDSSRHRTVLFAGYQVASGGGLLSDIWEWDGTNWSPRTPTAQSPIPLKRFDHAAAFDSTRNRLVVFGGYSGGDVGLTALGDTWEWNSSAAAWSQATPDSPSSSNPSPRSHSAMSYDLDRQRVVLFGGDVFNGTYDTTGAFHSETNELWEWNNSSWTQRITSTGPSARTGAAMAYDALHHRSVMYSGVPNETWWWNGTTWTHPLVPNPPARTNTAMVYDAARQNIVMFGGYNPNDPTYVNYFSDTWLYDGLNWSQQTPAIAPQKRWGHAMAYDASRQRVVLYGGYGGFLLYLNDTWEWDGTSWTQILPPIDPGGRRDMNMFYDDLRQRIVLIGGDNVDGNLNDIWEWDGQNWTPQPVAPGPPTYSAPMVFDSAHLRAVHFGGYATGYDADTWFLSIAPLSFRKQPASQNVSLGASVLLSLIADSSGPLTYQWQRNNAPLDDTPNVLGTHTPTLQIRAVGASDLGSYTCFVTDGCNDSRTSNAAALTSCPPDFNGDGVVSVQDIFDFLNAWFAGNPRADFNGGGITVQDIFDFLNAWFVGC